MKDINILINNGVALDSSLEVLGDIDTYNETVEDFLDEINEKFQNIKISKENNDLINFGVYAHSIKSDAKYLGLKKLASIAYEAELAGKEKDADKINLLYDQLIAEISNSINILNEYIGIKMVDDAEENVISDKTILVVDDSDIIRNFITKVFDDTYNVIIAHDGKDAIDVLNTSVFDNLVCILLDLNMPHMNGFEVLDYLEVNNYYEKIPVAIITGDDSKDTVERAFTYPIFDVLQKPFNEVNVKNIVEKMTAFNNK